MICGNCGTENLAGAKFCMECASPLAAGAVKLLGLPGVWRLRITVPRAG